MKYRKTDGTWADIAGLKGSDGKSAFASAVEGGYSGTEAEFYQQLGNSALKTELEAETTARQNAVNTINEKLTTYDDKFADIDQEIEEVANRVSGAVANTVDNPFVTAYWKDSMTNKLYLVKVVNGVLTVTEHDSNGSGGVSPPIDIPTDTLLTGKTFWFVGDSITHGDSTKSPYECLLNETTGLIETNKGYSSSTISDYVNKSPMVNRVASYKNMDYVVVFGGTNDFEFHVPIGETYSEEDVLNVDSKTFKGALNKMINTLKSNATNIYFMTPIHRNPTLTSLLKETATNDAGHTFIDYVNAIKEICELHDVTVFDAYNECNLNPNNESDNSNYFADGLHPNVYGHKKIASYVANKLGVTMPEYVITDTITLNKTSISISSPLQLVATVSPVGNKVVYSSYNEDVATVDATGKITPRKNGSTIIIANSEGKIAKCEVTVTGQSEDSSVIMPQWLDYFNHFCIAYDENATESTKKYVLVATHGEGINYFYYSGWNCVAYDFSSNADSAGYAWYSEDGKTWTGKQNLGGGCRVGITHIQTSKIINASNDIYSQWKKIYDVATRESNAIASF